MSIAGYFGPADLRVKPGDLLKGVTEMMDGRLPVEEAAEIVQGQGHATVAGWIGRRRQWGTWSCATTYSRGTLVYSQAMMLRSAG